MVWAVPENVGATQAGQLEPSSRGICILVQVELPQLISYCALIRYIVKLLIPLKHVR